MITIDDKVIGDGSSIYIIAEMACAHDGDIAKAKRLVDAAVNAEADAVQLQFFIPEQIVTPDHDIFSLLKKISFNDKEWGEIFDYAKSRGIHVFACTYDVPSAELALRLGVDGIKLNSSDLSNPKLLEIVASSGIPFTLGTGASTFEEIAEAVETCRGYGCTKAIIMHGVQNFPTQIENANIAKMKMLKRVFPLPVGYQDHTDASDSFSQVVDLLAVGLGANVIEKHITLDRSEKGTDYQAALEPDEFIRFVQLIRTAEIAMGDSFLQPLSDNDRNYRRFQKKSIVSRGHLNKGHILSESDVLFLRARTEGMAPKEITQLLGRKLGRDIPEYSVLQQADFLD